MSRLTHTGHPGRGPGDGLEQGDGAGLLSNGELMPAWRRYNGRLYKAAGSSLQRYVGANLPLVIVSGGYGVILGTEDIAYYDREFRPADWRGGLVAEAVASHARTISAEPVIALVSASTGYGKSLTRHGWRSSGVSLHIVSPVKREFIRVAEGLW